MREALSKSSQININSVLESETEIMYPVLGTFRSFDKTLKLENYCKEGFKGLLGGSPG